MMMDKILLFWFTLSGLNACYIFIQFPLIYKLCSHHSIETKEIVKMT
jgi:hypothetical protein